MISSFKDVDQQLQPFVYEASRLQGSEITIDRTRQLARHVGSPERRLKVIHVAGTSGKTSTSYYVASLLAQSGQKVGLTVSPHIDSIAERVQINMSPLGETEFCRLMEEYLGLVESAAVRPTYFELMMVFAYWVFDKLGVDYAVIETGLGGQHDSSNICAQPDKVAIITDIGFDHMHILGNSLQEIARQKAGIIHPLNTVITYRQKSEITNVIEQVASMQNARTILVEQPAKHSSLPLFQERNWTLAKAAFDYLSERDGLELLSERQIKESQLTVVPGRMEIFNLETKSVVLDGAHNPQKLNALIHSYREIYSDERPLVLLALKKGKDTESIAPLIAELASEVVITKLEISQDVPHESESPDVIKRELIRYGVSKITIIESNAEAYRFCLDSANRQVMVVGSLYLVSQIRKLTVSHSTISL